MSGKDISIDINKQNNKTQFGNQDQKENWEPTRLGLYTYLYRRDIDVAPKLRLKLLPLGVRVSNEVLELINCDRLIGVETTQV